MLADKFEYTLFICVCVVIDPVLIEKSIAFTETALNIKPTATPQVHLTVNVAKFWHGPVKIADLNVIHNVGDNAVSMSRNFADGFLLDHVHQ
jgi:hypothetical protein